MSGVYPTCTPPGALYRTPGICGYHPAAGESCAPGYAGTDFCVQVPQPCPPYATENSGGSCDCNPGTTPILDVDGNPTRCTQPVSPICWTPLSQKPATMPETPQAIPTRCPVPPPPTPPSPDDELMYVVLGVIGALGIYFYFR